MSNIKLTKEQAAWLIDRIDIAFGGLDVPEHPPEVVFFTEAKKIISQCTDKPFPSYRFHATYNEVEYELNISYEKEDPNMVFISTNCANCNGNESSYAGLKPDEFIEFAEGVNKIAQWLKEQDDAKVND